MSSSEKGKFSANISQDVIREALDAVRRRGADEQPGDADASADLQESELASIDAPAEPSNDDLQTLRAQLEMSQAAGRELMEKLKDAHERMLRAVADLDNFKKRAAKEKDEVHRFGTERLLKEFLPVMDNLERALEHAQTSGDLESLRTGVAMTRKQFEDALARHGVKQFSALGQAFDPRIHEAMQQVERTDVEPNHVVGELVRGYTLNDRLVRPALVMVSKAPVGAAAKEPAAAGKGAEQSAESDDVIRGER